MIWPKIVQYWAANNIRAEVTNPRDGVLESEWVAGDGADAEQIFADITSGDSNSSKQHKFRLVVEPGIRSGSTEVYLLNAKQPVLPVGQTGRVTRTTVSLKMKFSPNWRFILAKPLTIQ